MYGQLREITNKLEKHYRDVQDFEFTIQEGTLFMLQTRTGKRTAQAAVNIAVDMVTEGLITKEEAVLRVEPRPSTSSCTPSSTPRRRSRSSPRALRHRPAPRRAGRVQRRRGGKQAKKGQRDPVRPRPRPTTSTAWMRPRVSSRPAAA